MNAYTSLENENRFVLFVNSSEPPHEEIPLDHYRYIRDNEGYQFFRLYRIIYLREKEIKYERLDWIEVEVKKHCVNGLKQFIDLMAPVNEFLVT